MAELEDGDPAIARAPLDGAAQDEPVAFEARLGIFARTFRRQSAAQVATAVAEAGYSLAHWNFAAIGLSTLADEVNGSQFTEVRDAFRAYGLQIPSVSATFNAVHPDPATRQSAVRKAVRLVALAPLLGAEVVTLCSGTRDPDDMWHAHPDNGSRDAWTDLRRTLDELLEAASAAGVRLGVEPEPGNVIANAALAARLLHEIGDDAPLGIVFDPANLLSPDTVGRQIEILNQAFDLLQPHILSAHAKDVVAGGYSAPGVGLMDYHHVLDLIERVPGVPLIVQDAEPGDAARVNIDLRRWHQESRAGGGA
ncbi:sugar phosphate isomerase/epimerase family protein [Actinospica robiniae]|uniref:sugar phosphate isomerase/epimerase family protein n=1 Tax=Actinospica robiniae TaxID=304901 RepID=UPI00146FA60B|nr:sugar phosphate isomerase/epimerase [Actinospica robiniae]